MSGTSQVAVCLSICTLMLSQPAGQDSRISAPRLHPLERSQQFLTTTGSPLLADASALVRVAEARARMKVSGKGFAAVVIDTGIYADHKSFCGRVALSEDFTGDTRPNASVDRDGHGTNVAGIIAASADACNGDATGVHHGIAPGAVIHSLKAVNDFGDAEWEWVGAALRRAIELVREPASSSRTSLIGAVNLSVGSFENLTSDKITDRSGVIAAIRELATLRVPVVVAAGNNFFESTSVPGMAFPAIVNETISVGAVFNKAYKDISFGRAFASLAKPGQIAPFSQRFHVDHGGAAETDLFAPGAEISSTGILSPASFSVQKGTSQAAPMVTGAILLLQEYYNARRQSGAATLERPPLDDVLRWLRDGSQPIRDDYGESDNVDNTGKSYRMLSVLGAMEKLKADADKGALR